MAKVSKNDDALTDWISGNLAGSLWNDYGL